MSTLTKFSELKAAQQAEREKAEQEYKALQECNDRECKRVYNKFVTLIKPFDNQIINGHKISLKFDNVDLTIEMSIDGKVYTTFAARTTHHYCGCSACCEGYTGHESSYTYDIKSCRTDKNNLVSGGPYFGWYYDFRLSDDESEMQFASLMDSFMTTYHNEYEWNKHTNKKK